MAEYFIRQGNREEGPLDLFSVVRRIRSGRITRETLIARTGEEQFRSAAAFEELREVLVEAEQAGSVPGQERRMQLGYLALMRGGVEFLMQHVTVCVYAGIFLLTLILGAALLVSIFGTLVGTLLAGVFGAFTFFLFLISMLRRCRMQLVGPRFFRDVLKRFGKQLLVVSLPLGILVFALPVVIAHFMGPLALIIILFPGSLVMLWLFYAPVLVVDRGMKANAALRQSFAMMGSIGGDNFITLYLVLLTNFIAATIPVFLLVTLPITLSALCEVYDTQFNQFYAEL
jgi:hypothetical protein